MAGNPFRRPQQAQPAENGPLQDYVAPPKGKSAGKKKKVKIQTPPHSPEEIPRRLSGGNVSPPPPPPTAPDDNEDSDDSDSTATADLELEQALRNTRRNSGSLPPQPASGASTSGAPHNPFARTLATNEASFGLQRSTETQDGDKGTGDGANRPSQGRQALDVDAFKNILMTGSAAAPSPPTTHPSQRPQDSSSNTDASSGSRYSLSEPYIDVHGESPRTSFDDMESPSESDNDGDEEHSGLMSSNARLDDFAPPAPPKHSHGKPLAPKGPQTVSFADFDTSLSPASANNTRPPMTRRSVSDLNKPLPPPPSENGSAQQTAPSAPESLSPTSQQPTPDTTTADENLQTKKVPPPPPPASRRAGQASSSHNRMRSTSNATDDSITEESSLSTSKPAESTPKSAAPPPPPSRKARPASQISTAAAETPPAPAPSSTEAKSMPRPPPRRNASKTDTNDHRSPSTASRSSISRTAPNPNAAPPPAPPPRRGVNPKRESVDEPTGTNQRPADEENDASSSILADMDSFQKEIDALRAKSGRQD